MNKTLKKRIIETQKAIRKKYLALKTSKAETAQALEEQYKPLVKPLKEIATKISKENAMKATKFEPKVEVGTNTAVKLLKQKSTEISPVERQDSSTLTEYQRDYDDVFEPQTSSTIDVSDITENPSFTEYVNQYPPLVREYVKNSIRDAEGKTFDHTYGPRYRESDDKWLLGNSIIDFKSDDVIKIKNETFKGTIGLYELLFNIIPDSKVITQQDKVNYHRLLDITSAHKRDYDPTKQYNGNKYYKWKEVIRPLIMMPHSRFRERFNTTAGTTPSRAGTTPSRGGKGVLMDVTRKPFDYRYWNDPNELVDRLRLLWAEQDAGHTGHNNEINAILEELREAYIIW